MFNYEPTLMANPILLDMSEIYRCSKCGKSKERSEFHESPSQAGRPVTYHCKLCRRGRNRFNEIFTERLKKYRRLCIECEFPRKIVLNGICGKCLKSRGLKQCNKCKDILPLDLCFYKNKAICIDCYTEK